MLMKPPCENYTYGTRKPDPVTGLINVHDRDVLALEMSGWVKAEKTKSKKPKRIALTDTPKDTES